MPTPNFLESLVNRSGINYLAAGLEKAGVDPRDMAAGMSTAPSQMAARVGANFLPFPVGDAVGAGMDAHMYLTDPSSRTWGNALLSALGVLPFVPGMTVYHGSPHKFDKFDSSKIGTGEGAQAYGHGLYFAEDPKVAGQYQRQVSSDVFRVADGELFDPSKLEHLNVRNAARTGDLDSAIKRAQELARSNSPVADLAARDLQTLQSLKVRGGITPEKGSLYHVDIPDEQINKMLDWDKPLSEQPESVRKVLADNWLAHPDDHANMTGRQIYEAVTKQFEASDAAWESLGKTPHDVTNIQHAASEYLKKLGIPGIRYLDAGSRPYNKAELVSAPTATDARRIAEQFKAKGYENVRVFDDYGAWFAEGTPRGTRNFVVFDDSIVKILNRE